jgi:hypothetical protein
MPGRAKCCMVIQPHNKDAWKDEMLHEFLLDKDNTCKSRRPMDLRSRIPAGNLLAG